MNAKLEKFLVIFVDFLTINLSWILYYIIRVESGWFNTFTQPEFLIPMLVVYLYWFTVFVFVGMYQKWFASSRFEELSTLFKSTFVGIFILFFLIFYDDQTEGIQSTNRFYIFIYWGIFLLLVSLGRLFIRNLQRNLLIKGYGRKKAVIVGFNKKANNIHSTILKHPALGLDIVAYSAVKKENVGKDYKGIKVFGTADDIDKLIDETGAKEVIIALEKNEDEVVFNTIVKCEPKKVSIKIVPDLYDIISGQAKTSQIYGYPLIDIHPQLMPVWEQKAKRILDIFVSFIILILSSPVTLISAVIIKLESEGPVFYLQERSGIDGETFFVYKFRSMVKDAEKLSGPVWSQKDDPRVTKYGKFMRKVRIDEIPQMINVLKGEMSLVGPRPERPFFVEKLSQEIPLYKRRLSVRPGVTGWAQVRHKYDETIDDVKEKLRYDLFYIENMSLRMDLNILFRTVFVILFGKGHFE